jgi:hypothetical protein
VAATKGFTQASSDDDDALASDGYDDDAEES